MELLYVWIEDYKNIKKQGFNFSPKHWFEYDEKTNSLKHEDKNPNYPKDFFGDNISNVTAIVGKNGSGKSSILEFLFNWHIPSKVKQPFIEEPPKVFKAPIKIKNKIVFIFREKNGLKGITNIDGIKQVNINTIEIDIERFTEEVVNSKRPNYLIDKANILPIFYSNIFSEDLILSEIENPYVTRELSKGTVLSTLEEKQKNINLSTTYQLIYNSTWGKQFNEPLKNIISRNYLENQLHIARFIADSINTDIVDIQLPPYIILKSVYEEKQLLLDLSDAKKLPKDYYGGIFERSYPDQNNSPEDEIIVMILKQLTNQYDFNLFNQSTPNFRDVRTAFDDIIDLLSKESSSIKKKQDYYVDIENVLEEIRFFSKNYLDDCTKNESFDLRKKTEMDRFSLLIKNCPSLLIQFRLIHPQLSFNKLGVFVGLSTGEQMLLKMYGKLWNVLLSIEKQNLKEKSILLLLDEADLTLHPDWQKSLLEKLKCALNKFFKNYNIQLVLTTHSPFLVSDLPKENIIFLDKDKNTGDCIVSKPEDMSHTFGANIHSLYRNSFFLENGLMGEFAKGKIDGVIKDLNQDDANNTIDESRQKEMQFIIEQIGEPLIKDKLLQKYKARFEPIEDQINELRLKIEKLEASRKK